MGSQAEETPFDDNEITVLVTGFAPFRTQYPINPSYSIASLLPPFLPPHPTTPSISSLINLPRVRILVHPSPIKVSYTTVRDIVPKLWAGRKIDYAIHIGMASGRKYYSVERRAHRDGYYGRDVDGELPSREWEEGVEEEYRSDVDVDDVWRRWRTSLPETDLRVSEDAGRYLCDYIYYTSLSHLARRGEEKRVVFLHVPVEADETHIKTGVEATIELIRAIVESGMLKRMAEKGREVRTEEEEGMRRVHGVGEGKVEV